VSIIREASPIKADPHRYASYWILKGLSEKILSKPYIKDENFWQSVPYEKIQAEALGLLQAHMRQLQGNPQNRKGVIKGE